MNKRFVPLLLWVPSDKFDLKIVVLAVWYEIIRNNLQVLERWLSWHFTTKCSKLVSSFEILVGHGILTFLKHPTNNDPRDFSSPIRILKTQKLYIIRRIDKDKIIFLKMLRLIFARHKDYITTPYLIRWDLNW